MTDGLRVSQDGALLSIVFDRPERKNPLTFAIYADLRDRFRALADDTTVKAVVLSGSGGNFCSGGDVHEIIGPLTRASDDELLAFTQMTGDVVKAMRAAPQPIVAAIDGICAGAGAILAMASDLRYGTEAAKVAFLFVRVGLSGADMGACALLPRIVGLGRAADLLYTGRAISGPTAREWGFFNDLFEPYELQEKALAIAHAIASGPTQAHATTKRMLRSAAAMDVDDEIDAEARAQAACMRTRDFGRAYEAFAAKRTPAFEGD
jgi:enoyl-CoA hydratase/carnithine racemase